MVASRNCNQLERQYEPLIFSLHHSIVTMATGNNPLPHPLFDITENNWSILQVSVREHDKCSMDA
jgi:hypothetical protein